MFKSTIIGHLGADAEAGSSNGKEFVRFRVATSRTYVKGDGQRIENTQWHSCIMSGNGGALLQFLKKGQLVCVVGENELGLVSSPKLKRMVATSDINVQSVELLGKAPDNMPQQVAMPSGELVRVNKAYYIELNQYVEEIINSNGRFVFDARNNAYSVDKFGFLTKAQEALQSSEQLPADSADAQQSEDVTPEIY